MKAICELFRLLNNPLRLKILSYVFASKDGQNVSLLADRFLNSGLGLSGVSQYLHQLERIGVIRRVRAGRYVNYVADTRRADPKVAQAVDVIVKFMEKGKGEGLEDLFGALMNPFRAQVVVAVAKAGSIPAVEICERLEHQMKYLKRDLQSAVDVGLLDVDDSDSNQAVYYAAKHKSPVVASLLELLA